MTEPKTTIPASITLTDEQIIAAVKHRFANDESRCFHQELFDALGDAAQEAFYTEEYRNPGDKTQGFQALGIWVAHSAQWSGEYIFDLAHAAFEDANFHTLNEVLRSEFLKQTGQAEES